MTWFPRQFSSGRDVTVPVDQQRFGRAELSIFPESSTFASAVDDAFMTGTDSNGVVISSANAPNTFDVLGNDVIGTSGTIQEFGIVTAPSLGSVSIDDNGTPFDLNDDLITYFANANANGNDSFSYVIVSGEGVRTVSEVTLTVGQRR